MREQFRLLVDAKNVLGEAPIWDEREQVLWWVDNLNPSIWRYNPTTGESRSWAMPENIGCIVLRENRGICAAMKSGFAFIDLDPLEIKPIVLPESDIPFNRMNDGRCDRRGRFWCGSMNARGKDVQREKSASLYRLDPDLTCHKMDTGFTVSNGIAFAPDNRTMYFCDTPALDILAYDYDIETGGLSNRRIFARPDVEIARVDGAAVDSEGGYWCAHVFDWSVVRYTPDGRIDCKIRLPTRNVTCVAWGGPNFDILYVTSATTYLAEQELIDQPNAGGLWEIRGTGYHGLPEPRFGG
jgi:sugar lactone lactonase YvrE